MGMKQRPGPRQIFVLCAKTAGGASPKMGRSGRIEGNIKLLPIVRFAAFNIPFSPGWIAHRTPCMP